MKITWFAMSPPVWGAWVEISLTRPSGHPSPSPPVWGAWVEIRLSRFRPIFWWGVAPRVGGVG